MNTFSRYTPYIEKMNAIEQDLLAALNSMKCDDGSVTIKFNEQGLGYPTNGTFKNVALIGGSGDGMLADVTITTGIVTAVVVTYTGNPLSAPYQVTDKLTIDEDVVGTPITPAEVEITAYTAPTGLKSASLTAISDYKVEVQNAIGGGGGFNPETPSAYSGLTDNERKGGLYKLQSVIDNVEEATIVYLDDDTAGLPPVGCGYPNDVREQRATLIASLYAAYKVEYDSLNP